MTPRDLITLTLKMAGVNGVGQTPRAEDMNDCFTVLNMMLDTWQRRRWLVWHLQDIAVPLNGSQFYTIGQGGMVNVTRPDRIETAYARQIIASVPNQVDFPLRVVDDREEYSMIMLKNFAASPQGMAAPPSLVFYDSDYPIGKIYVWPPSNSYYELHIVVKQPLSEFGTLSDQINLPPEYREAMLWNLAARIRPMYGLPPDPTTATMAATTLNGIRVANSQVAPLAAPVGLPGVGVGGFGGWGGFVEGTATVDESTLG